VAVSSHCLLTHAHISSAIFPFPPLSTTSDPTQPIETPASSCVPFALHLVYSTMKVVFLSVLLPLVAAFPFSVGTIHNEAAPLLSSSNAKEVPNSYLVVFKKHVTHEAANVHHNWVQDLHYTTQNTKTELRKRGQFPIQDTVYEGLRHTYNIAGNLLGYSGHFDDDVIEQVRRHPDVSLCFPSIRQKLTCSLSRSSLSNVTRKCTPWPIQPWKRTLRGA
jgi:hypothetical protein